MIDEKCRLFSDHFRRLLNRPDYFPNILFLNILNACRSGQHKCRFTKSADYFSNIFEDCRKGRTIFRTFTKITEYFQNIFKACRRGPTFAEHKRRLPKRSDYFPNIYEDYRIFLEHFQSLPKWPDFFRTLTKIVEKC